MGVEFNTNINLLMGGRFCGNSSWNKSASSIDNCFKLYFVKSGKARIIENTSTTELLPGKLYFINGYKLDLQKSVEPFVVDWIHFLPKSLYFNYVLKESAFVTELSVEEFTSFHSTFDKLDSYFAGILGESEMRCIRMEIQALAYFTVTRIFCSIESDKTELDDQVKRILPALNYIAENFSKEISLKQLGELCCLSPNYFHRIFTNIFEVSPLNYIRNLRLEEATRQLAYTSDQVKNIAFNVGYDDEAYFSRVFSREYGSSPGAYRKRFKRNVP